MGIAEDFVNVGFRSVLWQYGMGVAISGDAVIIATYSLKYMCITSEKQWCLYKAAPKYVYYIHDAYVYIRVV